jgi:hypothetical protein
MKPPFNIDGSWNVSEKEVVAPNKETTLCTEVCRNSDTSHDKSFKAVLAVYEKNRGTANEFDGIGLVLKREFGITILDLDNKMMNPATDKEKALFERILAEFKTYVELSPSGTGYHVVLKGNLPLKADGNTGRHIGSFEAYDSKRYMCFTGMRLDDAEVEDCQEQLDKLIAEVEGERVAGGSVVAGVAVHSCTQVGVLEGQGEAKTGQAARLVEVDAKETDAALMLRFRKFKSYPRMMALATMDYDKLGYSDNSVLDKDLITLIANSTQSNAQVRRIFRTSLLGQRPDRHMHSDRLIDLVLVKVRDFENQRQAAHLAAFNELSLGEMFGFSV